ncbi:hypothetical protein B0H67DRAFT_583485 [Lasiosphaeris hirsuta]|uniref:NmrA-like domain-containing protein n=1 Tax=Lasiosphaeris hirsuta TaxID=260670 RepID=A0AA40A7J9_9PEZI|nr:hypothetical protein B0H67DRAFT_583485 [Lasiosphaeris hirsuta]
MPSILIIGLGELGTAIQTALQSHPLYPSSTLAILRRDTTPSPTNAALLAADITLEPGDFMASPLPDLTATFRKYDVIIQAAGMGLTPGTQLRVTAAVLAAGVPRYFPWQFGLDYPAIGAGSSQDLFDEMLAVREKLAGQSATKWTVVSTGLFMSFLFVPGFGVVDLKEKVVRALGGWETRVTVTTPEGIGRIVAELVYHPTEERVVYVAGDTVSYGQVADLVEGAYGGGFRREVWDMQTLRGQLEKSPDDGMVKYRNVFGAGVGTAWGLGRTVNCERGMPMTSLGAYLKEHKDRLDEEARG